GQPGQPSRPDQPETRAEEIDQINLPERTHWADALDNDDDDDDDDDDDEVDDDDHDWETLEDEDDDPLFQDPPAPQPPVIAPPHRQAPVPAAAVSAVNEGLAVGGQLDDDFGDDAVMGIDGFDGIFEAMGFFGPMANIVQYGAVVFLVVILVMVTSLWIPYTF